MISLQMVEGIPCGTSDGEVPFNPLTALGDLLDAARGEIVKGNDAGRNDSDAARTAKEFKRIFGLSFPKRNHAEFFEKMQVMRSVILCEKRLSLETFEMLRSFMGLKFSYEIALIDPPALNRCETGFTDTSLKPGFVGNDEALHAVLAKSKNNLYVYTCSSMEDVAFSIMHYLILSNYTFAECEHCERIFARKSAKQKYCPRDSPCKGYEKYNCSTAVDKAVAEIKRRRSNIRKNLGNYYPGAIWRFDQCFDSDALDKGEKLPTDWIALEALLHITEHGFVKEHWYRSEYKVLPK